MRLRESELPAYFKSLQLLNGIILIMKRALRNGKKYESLKHSTKQSLESWPEIQQNLRGTIHNFSE